jgi:hypothetical protein
MTIRKIAQQTGFVTLLLLVIMACLTRSTLAQDPPPEETSSFDPRFGIVDSFVNVEEANAAGAGWTRVFLRWDVIQPGGPSDWKPANVPDTFLNAEIAAGREVVAVLIGTPAWATESGRSTAVPPIEYWGDFVFKIATQYKGRITHWVIWNQPDITDPASPNHTWDGTAEDYYRLLKEAYLKIKAVDPDMQVHLAGLTYTWDQERGNPQYLAQILDQIVADPQAATEKQFFDVVSYHLYDNPRQILDILTDVRAILDRYGLGHKPIWLNETNAPPSQDLLEPVSAPGALSVTLEEQSAFVIQAFALALAGGAERVAFHKMRNETTHPESIRPSGLLRGDNSRRPAFQAFQTVTRYFAGTDQATWQQLNDVYVVTLNQSGQTTTVVWTTARTPITFSLNAIASQAVLVDAQGNEQPITANNSQYTLELPGATCSNGTTCFIGGAPRLVVEAGSPDQRAALLPASTPNLVSTPALVEATAEAVSGPTEVPVAAETATSTPLPPPTLTPTPVPPAPAGSSGRTGRVQEGDTLINTQPAADEGAPPAPGVLPDPDQELPAEDAAPAATVTPVPPVNLLTVLKPRRMLWLLIVGLVVFTVSYGVQVVIWYRLKR